MTDTSKIKALINLQMIAYNWLQLVFQQIEEKSIQDHEEGHYRKRCLHSPNSIIDELIEFVYPCFKTAVLKAYTQSKTVEQKKFQRQER
jgi:hypothetical protein